MKRLLAAAALLLLAACSTEGHVTPISSASSGVPSAATWSLSVYGCSEPTQCEDLRTALVGRLVGSGLAERIVVAGQPADLSLEVRVTNVRAIPGVARILFGIMAGRNEVASTDTLRDRAGTVLRSFTVQSASAAHPFSGESNLSDAYRQFAADTVSGVR